MTLGTVLGHRVERVVADPDLSYRCVECGLEGVQVVPFDQYECDPRALADPPVSDPDVDPDPAPDRGR